MKRLSTSPCLHQKLVAILLKHLLRFRLLADDHCSSRLHFSPPRREGRGRMSRLLRHRKCYLVHMIRSILLSAIASELLCRLACIWKCVRLTSCAERTGIHPATIRLADGLERESCCRSVPTRQPRCVLIVSHPIWNVEAFEDIVAQVAGDLSRSPRRW